MLKLNSLVNYNKYKWLLTLNKITEHYQIFKNNIHLADKQTLENINSDSQIGQIYKIQKLKLILFQLQKYSG